MPIRQWNIQMRECLDNECSDNMWRFYRICLIKFAEQWKYIFQGMKKSIYLNRLLYIKHYLQLLNFSKCKCSFCKIVCFTQLLFVFNCSLLVVFPFRYAFYLQALRDKKCGSVLMRSLFRMSRCALLIK